MSSVETPAPSPAASSHPLVTPDDHRSLLNILGWFLSVVVVIVVATRLGTRWAKSRSISMDDTFIVFSMFIAIVQTICVSIGVSYGLGAKLTLDIPQSHLDMQQKMIYTFTIFFIISQYFSKLSIIAFIMALSPNKIYHQLTYGLFTLCTLWALTGIFGFAFQCHTPDTWRFIGNECFDRVAFYTFIEVFNIFLDASLSIFPSIITYRLQLQLKRKMITIVFFMSRILVVAASVIQLIVIYHEIEDPFLTWSFAVLLSIIQSLGIITACGPYLKPFLESLNSGMIGNDDIRRRGGGTVGYGYGSKGIKGSKDPSSNASNSSKPKGDGAYRLGKLNLSSNNKSWTQSVVTAERSPVKQVDGETNSQSSESRMIRQTTTYMVRTDTR